MLLSEHCSTELIMGIKENLAKEMSKHGATQYSLAASSHVPQPTIQRILSGETLSPKLNTIKKLANGLKINLALLTDDHPNQQDPTFISEKKIRDQILDSTGNVTYIGRTAHEVPLISLVTAGQWCEQPELYHAGDAEEWMPKPRGAGERTYALRVDGDSMTSPFPNQRSYPHGIIIYVDPDKPCINGSRVIAKLSSGETTFKTYVEDMGKRYLKPINTQYDKLELDDGSHICGVIIGSYIPE